MKTAKQAQKLSAVVWIARILVGLLFIFSGLIKANDPLGFGYKLEEYFGVFHLFFLSDYAVAMAIFLCGLEVLLGAALLLGYKARVTLWGLLALIVFFTFLTFYSAFFKVVQSCGCFGDAIPLTPWQSFFKDVILLILIVLLFVKRSTIKPLFNNKKTQDTFMLLTAIIAFGIGIYTYNYLPFIDFLPYKEGNNLPALMHIPPGAPQDEYEIIYTMKNKETGEEKKLNDKEYLKSRIYEDERWEMISASDPVLVKEGYNAKIKGFRITDAQGVDYTSEILENPYYNLIVVAYSLEQADRKGLGDMNALALNAAEFYNTRSVLLTNSSAQSADEISKANKLVFETFYADDVPLKSMVRANPGLILMKNGTVIKKWHYHNLPTFDELKENYFDKD